MSQSDSGLSPVLGAGLHLGLSPSHLPFTQRSDAIEAFLFYRPHDSLRVGVAVRRDGRRAHETYTRGGQPLPDAAAMTSACQLGDRRRCICGTLLLQGQKAALHTELEQ